MKAMVTRTVKATKATITVYNKNASDTEVKNVILDKVYDEPAKIEKAINKILTPSEVLINVESTITVHSCYGVPVDKFMEIAVELDPTTRKTLSEAEAEA